MEAAERLEAILKETNNNPSSLGKAIGNIAQTFYDIQKGKIKSISADVANKIVAKYPQIDFIWLTTGDGEMLKPNTATDVFGDYELPEKLDNTYRAQEIINRKKPKTITNVSSVANEKYMVVEYQDLATAAGVMGSVMVEELPEVKTMLVPREYDNGKYLVVRVDGDSMDDGSKYSIPNGSQILIKEFTLNNGDTLPIRNNLFVIVTREGVVFKQITKHVPDEYITLHSYNEKYQDYDVAMEDVLQIFIYRKIVSNRPEVKPI